MSDVPRPTLERITKAKRQGLMCERLRAMGIPFQQDWDGWPLVAESVYDAWLGGGNVSAPKDRPKLVLDDAA